MLRVLGDAERERRARGIREGVYWPVPAALKKRKGRDIWLVGGSKLPSSFPEAGMIDVMVISVVPGDGIPLFSGVDGETKLRLRGSRRYACGIVRLHFGRADDHFDRGARPDGMSWVK